VQTAGQTSEINHEFHWKFCARAVEPCVTPAPQKPSRALDTASDALIEVARTFEPERYLAATLAREPQRRALLALAAYAADLARIPATATQPMLGEIRLQWWRDSLELIGKGSRIGSPLADALGDAVQTYALPLPMLAAMSEARAFDLYDDPMPDEASLDGYLSKTEALPFELALRVAGVPAGDAGALAVMAGRAFGLTRMLVRLPEALATGRTPLPSTLLQRFGIEPGQNADPAAMRAMLLHISGEIRTALDVLRPQVKRLTRQKRVPLLPLAIVSPHLRSIERHWQGPMRDIAELAPLTRVWRIAVAHVSGRV
jgi:15-cis-phytoene synthase